MKRKAKDELFENLPASAAEFIKLVIRKMRYRKKVRVDVMAELTAHFEDELKDCKTDEEKEKRTEQLIADFGDVKLLAVLMRRAKKRCRPLWQKVAVRAFQTAAVILLYLIICASPLIFGRPTIAVDYVERLNELVRAGRNEADNAKPCYEKAAELCVEMPQWLAGSKADWLADFNDVQMHSLSLWLEDNRQAFEALRKAAGQPYFWNHYQSDPNTYDLVVALMPNVMRPLSAHRALAFAMRWRIRYEAYKGNVDSAMKDCIVLQKFGEHLQGNGLLIEQLVGIAMKVLAYNEILEILDKTDVPAETLKTLQDELAKQLEKSEAVINVEAEKVFWYDRIQQTFTDDGSGDGRALLRGLPYALKSSKDMLRFLLFSYPSRKEVVADIDYHFEKFDGFLKKTPSGLENLAIYKNKITGLEQAGSSILLKNLESSFVSVSRQAWCLETHRRCILTIVAVMRYHKALGRYPDNLEELVSTGYLDSLPMDPYSDKPLVYKKTDDGFILYSIGEDFTDDGGQIFYNDQGRPRKWHESGDWVFWPVPKAQGR